MRVPTGALLYQSLDAGLHLCCATPRNRVTELITRMTEGIDDLGPAIRYSMSPRRSYLNRYSATAAASIRRSALAHVPEADDVSEVSPYTVDSAPDTAAGVTGLLRAALGVEGLHYLAYYAAGVPSCTVDILRHPALHTYFGGFTTPQRRRDRYSLLGQLLPGVTGRMNSSLDALLEGQIHQIVLTMEQGAVYFQHLGDRHYLLGISLDHSRPAEADLHIERLGSELTSE
ncbi:hypothetical protein [Streptomyces sp. YKOK-I1]